MMRHPPFVARTLPVLVMGLCWACAPTAGHAQPMADPTRAPYIAARPGAAHAAPPSLNPATAAMLRQAGVPAGALPSEANLDAAKRGGTPPPPAAPARTRHRLTSVMLGSGVGQSAAIIDGEVYRVGDKVQGSTLSAIDATGVLLGSGKGAARLSLFGRVAEVPAPAAAPSAATAATKATAPGGAVNGATTGPTSSLQNGARPDKDTP